MIVAIVGFLLLDVNIKLTSQQPKLDSSHIHSNGRGQVNHTLCAEEAQKASAKSNDSGSTIPIRLVTLVLG